MPHDPDPCRSIARRLGPHLFTLAAPASLLTCVGVGVLWARGGFEFVLGHYNRWLQPRECHAMYFRAASHGDTLTFVFDHMHFGPADFRGLDPDDMARYRERYPPGLPRWRIIDRRRAIRVAPPPPGFHARHDVNANSSGIPSNTWTLSVPHWLPMALLLLPPAAWLHHFRKTRRQGRQPGLCPTCGYDLRATPGRCPECGVVTAVGATGRQ